MDTFTNLIGQNKAIQLLQQAVKLERVAPAYLFYGSSGIGRSIAARSFTQLLLSAGLPTEKHSTIERKLKTGNHPDLMWVQPTYLSKGKLYTAEEAVNAGISWKTPPKIRVEQIRSITEFLNRPALEATRQVVVIEQAQTMAEAPANALLKTLEEPGKATIILIAPNAHCLLPTLVSRCQRIPFYSLSLADLRTILDNNGYAEILEHPELIAIAQGSPGQAIAHWLRLQEIPADLLQQLKQLPKTALESLQLAKAISSELDVSTQLWLVDYLQHYYWQQRQELELMKQWERTRKYLLSYVQPRLVWECALLSLLAIS